ncbi:MAG: DMT family transporter [Actinomycetia bacterium]|nr:DMT family transporter [Actinomycetes bacterium]
MQLKYWIWVIVAAIGWGFGGIATRAAFEEGVGVWTMIAVRTTIAALLVLLVLIAQRSPMPGKQVLAHGSVQAIFNLTIPYVLFTFAYGEASAGFVGLLAALIPLATAVYANFMLPNEPLTAAKVIGLFVAFSGVAALLLSGDSGLSDGGRPFLAVGLGMTAVISIGYGGTFAKRYAGSYSPIMLTGIQFGLAAMILVVAMAVLEGMPTDVTTRGWGLMVFMAVASTFMPFLLFFWLLQYISATDASLIGYLVPFVALIGGIVLLDEQLQAGIIVGGILVFTGMILADRAGRKAEISAVSARP